jgi:hypothetical protein
MWGMLVFDPCQISSFVWVTIVLFLFEELMWATIFFYATFVFDVRVWGVGWKSL